MASYTISRYIICLILEEMLAISIAIINRFIPSERRRGPEGTEETEQSLKESEEIQIL